MHSDNGWPGIIDADHTVSTLVPGTSLHLRTAPGDVAWILTRFAARFNTDVQALEGPVLDDWGYNYRNVRGSMILLSCHASGTAVDLNATRHPRGVRNTFSDKEEAAIRKIMADFVNPDTGISVIKWGKDFKWPSQVDEMHFQVRGNANDLAKARAHIESRDEVTEDDIGKIAKAVWEWDGIPNQGGPADNPDWTGKSMLSDLEKTQDQHTLMLNEILACLKGK
jgi:hypothetical protein